VELVDRVLKVLHEAGLLGLLLIILIGGFKGIWVFNWYHKIIMERLEKDISELKQERDDWKNLVVSAQVKERRNREVDKT